MSQTMMVGHHGWLYWWLMGITTHSSPSPSVTGVEAKNLFASRHPLEAHAVERAAGGVDAIRRLRGRAYEVVVTSPRPAWRRTWRSWPRRG